MKYRNNEHRGYSISINEYEVASLEEEIRKFCNGKNPMSEWRVALKSRIQALYPKSLKKG